MNILIYKLKNGEYVAQCMEFDVCSSIMDLTYQINSGEDTPDEALERLASKITIHFALSYKLGTKCFEHPEYATSDIEDMHKKAEILYTSYCMYSKERMDREKGYTCKELLDIQNKMAEKNMYEAVVKIESD